MSERIVISPPERKILESRARAWSGSVAEAMRSKIVLSLAAGNSQAHTSRRVGCGVNTVRLWKERFVKERLGGLYGRHHGRSRSKESVRLEARVLRLAQHKPTDGRSAMLAVDAELRAGGAGGSLLAESFATILTVHLIRHITGPNRELAAADNVLPRHKLHTVVEYIMENLAGRPTLEQMGAVVHLSTYHFARQFKTATGLAPHQYVIARRIERAQELLRTDRELGLAEVAFRSGFANQSHFCLHFRRIVGVTPRQFWGSARTPSLG